MTEKKESGVEIVRNGKYIQRDEKYILIDDLIYVETWSVSDKIGILYETQNLDGK